MEIRTPPHLDEFASLAEWKHARALYFKNLPRRDRTPKVIETVRTETVERVVEVQVEVIREVEVERIVYVDREVPAEPQNVHFEAIVDLQIPDFLRYDPLTDLIANERLDGETDEGTLQRLRNELLDYFALERGDGLTLAEEERKRLLSSRIKPTGD